jgi:hypothetical protein
MRYARFFLATATRPVLLRALLTVQGLTVVPRDVDMVQAAWMALAPLPVVTSLQALWMAVGERCFGQPFVAVGMSRQC